MSAQKAKDWLKKLAGLVGVASASAMIAVPVLAQYYPPASFFQPSQHGRVPIRSGDLAQEIASKSEFKTFATALEMAGLTKTLSEGRFTVFAPVNEAFDALPAGKLDELLQDTDKLRKVLNYHLVAGEISAPNGEVAVSEVTTVEGSTVKIDATGQELKLNDASALPPPVQVSNGVIIRIDRVLLPFGM
ncbi:MAG: fasciclin domain-containing protein [Oscillatoria princeps RMCB-10]|jgi:uncharacterized surface protein with fasciclin (FAS1) repeats|nr:fasciclin domain-containing protein [Oscillatoria princeps RMCB-10]